jgi:bifunctional non-homologous end joining protein LigD
LNPDSHVELVVRRKNALGIKAVWPGFIEPALASSIERLPDRARWIHEIEFDGYRVQLHIHEGQVKVFTCRGN